MKPYAAFRTRLVATLRQRSSPTMQPWYHFHNLQHDRKHAVTRIFSTGTQKERDDNGVKSQIRLSNNGDLDQSSTDHTSEDPQIMTNIIPSMEILEDTAKRADEALKLSLESTEDNTISQTSRFTDIGTCHVAALSAWVQCATKYTPDLQTSLAHAERAHQILLEWNSLCATNANIPPPSTLLYGQVLHAWNKGVSRKDPLTKRFEVDPKLVADRALELLDTLLHSQSEVPDQKDITKPPPTQHLLFYHTVIRLCTKVTSKRQKHSFLPEEPLERTNRFLEYSNLASQLLDELEVKREEMQHFELDGHIRKSYHAILRAFARTAKLASVRDPNDEHLYQQISSNVKGGASKAQNEKVLKVSQKAATEAERMLNQLQELYGPESATRHVYMEVLKAWCQVPSPVGAKKARDTLRLMERQPHVHVPDSYPYFLVLNAYAKVAHLVSFRATNRIAPAFEAHDVLVRMEKRLNDSNIEINKEVSSTQSNQELHDEYESDDDDEEEEDNLGQKMSIDKNPEHGGVPVPDAMCYGAAINAFAKSRIGKGKHKQYPAQFATAILDRMERLFEEGKIVDQPNLYCYGNALTAWANHEGDWADAAKEAEKMLERLENHFYRANDLQTAVENGAIRFWYNIVLRRIAESKLEDGPVRVENILTRMEELYFDSISTKSAIVVDPDSRSYYAAIKAWARIGHIRDISRVIRARDILNRLISIHEHKLSHRPPSDNCHPTTVCYNGVITACAYTLGDDNQNQALQIARETFLDLCESPYCKPNTDTFGKMIQCISRFESRADRRDKEIEEMFQMCCEAGEVNPYVLQTLKQVTEKDFYEKLTASQKILLPSEIS
mmetsp:Transcript_14864/g.21000  ORF Transcript_14864/g.21000 Transcript_14864/m.21000 type:complete len:841 (+) Transcript_14864:156-2678(+)